MNYYTSKIDEYYSHLRKDILPYIPTIPGARLLDMGCSAGNTLCYLKEAKIITEGVGVDFMEIPGSNQSNPLIDRFIAADIQQQNLGLPKNYFDILLCADVLEHLQDPWTSLDYLKTFVKPNGLLIVSIPNIREFRAAWKIFGKGDFAYAPSGVLDKTHMRFFCKKNIEDLVTGAGFKIETSLPSFKTCPTQTRRNGISKIFLGLFNQFLAQQYIVTARKTA